jgi:hypothetical protein
MSDVGSTLPSLGHLVKFEVARLVMLLGGGPSASACGPKLPSMFLGRGPRAPPEYQGYG